MSENEVEETRALDELGEDISSANAAASKGPLAALLSPAFEIWGDKLSDFAKWTVRERKKNIQAHRRGVFQQHPEYATLEPSISRIKLLGQWYESAQDFGDDDKIQSAVWRAVLDEIITNSRDVESLISIAKQIDIVDLKALSILDSEPLKENQFTRDPYNLLVKKGLVERWPRHLVQEDYWDIFRSPYSPIFPSFVISVAVFALTLGLDTLYKSEIPFLSFLILSVFFSSMAFTLSFILLKVKWDHESFFCISTKGKKLLQKIREYLDVPLEEVS